MNSTLNSRKPCGFHNVLWLIIVTCRDDPNEVLWDILFLVPFDFLLCPDATHEKNEDLYDSTEKERVD